MKLNSYRSPLITEIERAKRETLRAQADRMRRERREQLADWCLSCVWATVQPDRIYCPIVGECWKNGRPEAAPGEAAEGNP